MGSFDTSVAWLPSIRTSTIRLASIVAAAGGAGSGNAVGATGAGVDGGSCAEDCGGSCARPVPAVAMQAASIARNGRTRWMNMEEESSCLGINAALLRARGAGLEAAEK